MIGFERKRIGIKRLHRETKSTKHLAKKGHLILALVLSFSLTSTAHSSDPIVARILGTANSSAATATGLDAVLTNPANLGLPNSHTFELNLFNVGALVYNSSLSLGLYNRYNGDSLDAAEKEDILSHFADGWHLGGRADLQLLAIRYRNFGFAISAVAGASQKLPKSIVETPLNGIELNQVYELGPFTGSAVAYSKFTVAYGQPLALRQLDTFSVGGGISYLHGYAVGEILTADGHFTNDYSAQLQWEVRTRTAAGGSGFSFDVGASGSKANVQFGLALRSLFSRINWSKDTEEQFFRVVGDSLNIFRADSVGFDDAIEREDTTSTIGSFSTPLPPELSLGIAVDWRRYRFTASYHQGLRERFDVSTSPEISLGAEARWLSFLPLRCGFAFGGGKGFRPAAGFGLHFLGVQWDFAVAGVGGFLAPQLRGLAFATNIRIAK